MASKESQQPGFFEAAADAEKLPSGVQFKEEILVAEEATAAKRGGRIDIDQSSRILAAYYGPANFADGKDVTKQVIHAVREKGHLTLLPSREWYGEPWFGSQMTLQVKVAVAEKTESEETVAIERLRLIESEKSDGIEEGLKFDNYPLGVLKKTIKDGEALAPGVEYDVMYLYTDLGGKVEIPPAALVLGAYYGDSQRLDHGKDVTKKVVEMVREKQIRTVLADSEWFANPWLGATLSLQLKLAVPKESTVVLTLPRQPGQKWGILFATDGSESQKGVELTSADEWAQWHGFQAGLRVTGLQIEGLPLLPLRSTEAINAQFEEAAGDAAAVAMLVSGPVRAIEAAAAANAFALQSKQAKTEAELGRQKELQEMKDTATQNEQDRQKEFKEAEEGRQTKAKQAGALLENELTAANRAVETAQERAEALKQIVVKGGKKACSDSGSGAKRSVAGHTAPGGFVPFAHAASGGGAPCVANSGLDVSKPQSPFKYNAGWSPVWSDKGSGKKYNYTAWIPKAPAGYVALGAVLNFKVNHGNPPGQKFLCLRKDLSKAAKITNGHVWSDGGTGAKYDLKLGVLEKGGLLWVTRSTDPRYHAPGAGPRTYCDPKAAAEALEKATAIQTLAAAALDLATKAELTRQKEAEAAEQARQTEANEAELRRQKEVEGVQAAEAKARERTEALGRIVVQKGVAHQTDSGTGADRDLQTFKVQTGFFGFGHGAATDAGLPAVASAGLFPDADNAPFKFNTGWITVWTAELGGGFFKKGSAHFYGIWVPIAPAGYVALGAALRMKVDDEKPPSEKFLCLREDLSVSAEISNGDVWSDKGTGAKHDVKLGVLESGLFWPTHANHPGYSVPKAGPRTFCGEVPH